MTLPPPRVQFVCMGKQHHQRRFPHVSFEPGRIGFKCGFCDRHLLLRNEKFAEILAGLHSAGIGEVDISALPY